MQQDDSSRREPEAPEDRAAPESSQVTPLPTFEEATVISDQQPLPVKGESDVDYSMANMSPSDLGRVLLGQRLAHYELREFVGGGGMGAVFRAHDTQLDRTVALKILSRDEGAGGEMLRRFRNEAQSAARLDHEYIARVYFFGEDRGLHYIVFEFIEGTNIRDMVGRTGPLSIEQALSYTIQVGEALNHAHSRNVVHRDIKPSNIIVTDEGRAKLVDMGLARLHQVQRTDDDLTASGVTLGTFDYISPEQARDPRNADVRSDIYSLGCTLFFMLTGRPPFPEGTVLQKLLQHQGDEAPDPRGWNPNIPDELWSVMRRMLAKDPRKRYQEPRPLLVDLVPIASHYGIQLNGGSGAPWQLVEPPAPTFLDRHVAWMVPVALLIVAAIAAQFVPLGSGKPAPSQRSILADSSLSAMSLADRGEEPSTESDEALSLEDSPNSNRRTPQPRSTVPVDDQPVPVEPERNQSTGASDIRPDRGASPATDSPSSTDISPPGDDRRVPSVDGEGDAESTSEAKRPSSSPSPENSQDQAASNAPAELDSSSGTISVNDNQSEETSSQDERFDDSFPFSDEDPAEEAEIRVVDERSRSTVPGPETLAEPGLLVVSPTQSGQGVYATLAEACRVATSGDVIELQFDGISATEPISLQDVNLTIRAGSGFAPIVSYEPSPLRGAAPRRSLMTLSGGRLTLVGVEFDLRLPPDVPSDAWSLLRIVNAEAVHLERCTLTISQAQDDPDTEVAFFRFEDTPILSADGSEAVSEVELQDCIARGEADLMRVNGSVSVALKWTNGLLATSRRLLEAVGTGQRSEAESAGIEVELNHVTAAMREGLCLLNETQRTPSLGPVKIRVTNCILVVDPNYPLIEQQGLMRSAELRQLVEWRGDRNFYEGFETFWEIHGLDQDNEPQKLTLRTWQSFWGGGEDNLPNYRRVGWETLPPLSQPFHTHAPADYALADDPSIVSAARNAASDGFDAGLRADRLPEVHSDVERRIGGN